MIRPILLAAALVAFAGTATAEAPAAPTLVSVEPVAETVFDKVAFVIETVTKNCFDLPPQYVEECLTTVEAGARMLIEDVATTEMQGEGSGPDEFMTDAIVCVALMKAAPTVTAVDVQGAILACTGRTYAGVQ